MINNTDSTIWEQTAPEYIKFTHNERKSYLKYLIYESLFSTIMELADGLKGKSVLDAGCGEGRLARIIATKGAEVTGCDSSYTMVQEAKNVEEKEKQGIEYFVHDLTKSFEGQKQYDVVVSNLVLFNIKELDLVLKNISKVVKPNGVFIFSIIHPCFNSSKDLRFNLRYIGKKGGRIVFNVSKSYKDQISYKADYRFGLINYYHRPIETYVTELVKNSMVVNSILEPILALNEIYDEKTFHQHFLPKFLIIRALKLK